MIADVVLPLPIDKVFSYAVPEVLVPFARPFLRAKVPFRSRSLAGFILDVRDGAEEGLKPLQGLLDCVPLVDEICFELCKWASSYYATPLGLALKYALTLPSKTEKYRVMKTEEPTLAHLDNLAFKKACALTGKLKVLDCLGRSLAELTDVFTEKKAIRNPLPTKPDNPRNALLFLGRAEERLPFYVSLIGEELSQGKNVLMLLPDYQTAGAFFFRSLSKSFPGAVFWYGSFLSEKKKAEAYFRAGAEGGRLILGNKSCVFLPVRDNSLIIVERPEEDEYRNEEGFRFNAVRLAVKRAKIEGARAVLGSAAPPVEALKRAAEGRVDVVEGKPFESPALWFMRAEKNRGRQTYLPDAMTAAIREVLGQRGNVVIHTPRRSYAANLSCVECGRAILCPSCGAGALSYHKEGELLLCNSCKAVFPYEEQCAQCGSGAVMFSEVGAEYLEARFKETFPETNIFRFTGATKLRDLGALEKEGGSLVVGTHVLSKLYGLRASLLILHGWEDVLKAGGYRAREKTFQTLANLIDALRPQKLLFYTRGEPLSLPLLLDPRKFYDDELAKRQVAEFPPYVRLASVNVLKRTQQAGVQVVAAIEKLTQEAGLDCPLLGPIETRGRYGWKVILKGRGEKFSALLGALYRMPGVHIETDPLNV